MSSKVSGIAHVLTNPFRLTGEHAGCYRDPSWPWWRQPFPWWTLLFLVPIYATCSSLANLQRVRSIQLPVMVAFACAAYATSKVVTLYVSDHLSVISAFGGVVIGLCGNAWSRLGGGTAFTSMTTGVLFLVPVSHLYPPRHGARVTSVCACANVIVIAVGHR